MRNRASAGANLAGVLLALLSSVAFAENPERQGQGPSSQNRLVGASSLRPVGKGFLSVGGSQLRHLPPGARQWKTLLRIQGDNLYRTAVDEAGHQVLASWEKDPFIH